MFSREKVLSKTLPRDIGATKGAGGVIHPVSTNAGVFKWLGDIG